MLALFDFPDPNAHSAKRSRTISPLQKMFALNSQFLLSQAKILDDELNASNQTEENEYFVRSAYMRLFQREPMSIELRLANDFLNKSVEQTGESDGTKVKIEDARQTLLQTLLISNEFIFVD